MDSPKRSAMLLTLIIIQSGPEVKCPVYGPGQTIKGCKPLPEALFLPLQPEATQRASLYEKEVSLCQREWKRN